MVLFQRVFAAVLLLFILLLGTVAYLVSVQQSAEVERQLIDKFRVLANSTADKLAAGHLDQRWPLQDLRHLSSDRDFLFWWVVDPSRRIHLADTAAVMGTPVDTQLDHAPREVAAERLALDRGKGYGILLLPLDTGARRWSFWVGFSLERVAKLQRRIVLSASLGAFATLTALGVLLYFIVRHFLKPIQVLTASAEVVGRGDLSHRAEVRTRDELGLLAASFNRMVEKLENTTVSRTYVDGILNSMADSVFVLDPELRIRTVNRSTCQLLGEREGVLISRPFSAICECGQEPQIAAVLAGSEIVNREAWFKTGSGSRIPVLFSASLMQEGHHEMRVVVTARDITELNQIKTELAKARDAALASARQKSEFLANMSHEIRTPMNGVIGMAELLAATPLSAEQRDYLEAVRCSAESLLGIINDVLDLSKIEAGKIEIVPATFDLRQWFDDLLWPLAFRAQQKGLELAGWLGGTVPATVVADSDRLRQVLINLVGNAIKFTARGEIEVAIETEDCGAGFARLRFSVRDTGIGIPLDKQRLIFESFTQADGAISRKYGGTGLGLTISSRLVRFMGSELHVESGADCGSTFHFTLEVPVERRVAARVLKPGRVLLAEAPGLSRRALEGLLAEIGAEVTTAPDGPAALAIARQASAGAFDLVLIDSRLPGAEASGLAAALRQTGALEGECVLMETFVDRHARGAGRGLTGLCPRMKPLRRADLLELAGVAAAPGGAAAVESDALPQPRSRLRILVVEDNAVNQKVAKRMLEKRDCQVWVAGSGEEAVAITAQDSFDLILMDIQMPGMTGIEAAAAIRAREAGSGLHCPIVALTADAMKGDREKYLATGMDDYLSKPLRSDELYSVVSRLTAAAAAPSEGLGVAVETQETIKS